MLFRSEHASHGKVSYGLCERFLKQLNAVQSLPNSTKLKNQFEKGDVDTLKSFWELYKKYDERDVVKLNFQDFLKEYDKKGEDKAAWGFSKFLGLYVLDVIITKKIEDGFVSKAVEYATSTSDLSAPFVKVE